MTIHLGIKTFLSNF